MKPGTHGAEISNPCFPRPHSGIYVEPMFGFIASRILQAIPVVLIVGFMAFALFAYIGDPVSIMLPQDHTEAQRLQLVHDLGLDQPFFVQYWHFLLNALHGNFGNLLPDGKAGGRTDCGPPAGNDGTGDHRDGARVCRRRADGRLYRDQPQRGCCRACSWSVPLLAFRCRPSCWAYC